MIYSDEKLDAKGLACPMPIVKTKTAMAALQDGQVLEIQATDQGSVADLVAWSAAVGQQYIGLVEQDGVFYHYIRKCDVAKNKATEKNYEKTITNEEAVRGDGLILDVREEAEFVFGHMPNAQSMPLGTLQSRMQELSKEQLIYVVCKTGTRSDLAAQQLVRAGFTNVYNVLPGMEKYDGNLQKEI